MDEKKHFSTLDDCYCVDITLKNVVIEQIVKSDFIEVLQDKNSNNLIDLASHDWHLFEHYLDAVTFCEAFIEMRDKLSLMNLKSNPLLPKILLKRKYIVTTLMQVKRFTTRHYKKIWPKGQLFQLYDQSFFVTVKLQKIEEVIFNDKVFYKYSYELV